MQKIASKTLTTLIIGVLVLSSVLMAIPIASVQAQSPAITLTPSSGPVGISVTISGTGFTPSTSVNIYFAGLPWATGISTDTFGAFSITQTLTFDYLPGSYGVTVADTAGRSASAIFTITAPSITLTPNASVAGDTITIRGEGFAPDATVQISSSALSGAYPMVNQRSTATTGTDIQAQVACDTTGAFTATFPAPYSSTGTQTITARNIAYSNSFATATLTTQLNVPAITLTPTSGPVGTVVTITGSGFGGNSLVTITQTPMASGATITVYPSSLSTTADGRFVAKFNIASARFGAVTITATDGYGNTASATFTITPALYIGDTTGDARSTSNVVAPNTANIRITLVGFPASSSITFTAPATAAITFPTGASTDANGFYSGTISVGTATPGTYVVTATAGGQAASTVIRVIPTDGRGAWLQVANGLRQNSISAPRGATVILGFLGFPEGLATDTYTITADGITVVSDIAVETTNGYGTVSFIVPSTLTPGTTYTITFTLRSGSATALLTIVSPSITVSSSGPPGSTQYVVGENYLGESTVQLNFGAMLNIASDTADTASFISTTGTGEIRPAGLVGISYTVPTLSAGTYSVTATDGVNSATGSFTIVLPTASISPTSGTPGTWITISGSGFIPSSTTSATSLEITVVSGTQTYTPAADDYSPITSTDLRTDYRGIIPYERIRIRASGLVAGSCLITISDGVNTVTQTFTVRPMLTLTPSAGRGGTTVTLDGAGFAAQSILSAAFDGSPITIINTATGLPATTTQKTTPGPGATQGNVPSNLGVVIPSTATLGAHTITLTDAAGNTASATFTVTSPTITTQVSGMRATQGAVGVSISIAGSGWAPGANIITTATFVGPVSTTVNLAATPTVGSTGTFSTSFTVPNVPAGSYVLTVRDDLGEFASTTFTVVETSITITPGTVAYLGTITVSGVGFAPGATRLSDSASTFGGTAFSALSPAAGWSLPLTWRNVDANGTFTFTIRIGSAPAGSYTIVVSDGIRSASSSVTVTPSITITPTSGLKGTAITVTGGGFAANSRLTIKFAGVTVASATSTTGGINTGGNIPAGVSFAVPITASVGNNTVEVVDALGNSASATFTVTTPSITLNPSTGLPGTTVQVIGTGFTPSSNIIIRYGEAIVQTTPSTVTTSTAGYFVAYFTVPPGATNATVTAADANNNVASANFTVIPPAVLPGTATFTPSAPKLLNSAGAPVTSVPRGTAFYTQIDVTSNVGVDLSVYVIAQIKDATGKVVALGLTAADVRAGATKSVPVAFLGIATPGTYTVTVYVWSSVTEPTPLAPTTTFDITVT